MALDEMNISTSTQIIEEVHQQLLWKVYNARSDEFLRSINKISCMHQNKSIDSVGRQLSAWVCPFSCISPWERFQDTTQQLSY